MQVHLLCCSLIAHRTIIWEMAPKTEVPYNIVLPMACLWKEGSPVFPRHYNCIRGCMAPFTCGPGTRREQMCLEGWSKGWQFLWRLFCSVPCDVLSLGPIVLLVTRKCVLQHPSVKLCLFCSGIVWMMFVAMSFFPNFNLPISNLLVYLEESTWIPGLDHTLLVCAGLLHGRQPRDCTLSPSVLSLQSRTHSGKNVLWHREVSDFVPPLKQSVHCFLIGG